MSSTMTENEMREEIRRLAPFHHNIELPYGLSTHVPEASQRSVECTRIDTLVRHAFPHLLEACGGSLEGKRVLDIACNCGGFSVEAARLGSTYVLGLDLVPAYIEQADFIKRSLDLEQIEFKCMDIDDLDQQSVGMFDVTFCFGILYHLENPVLSMKKIAAVTRDIMLVDTNVLKTSKGPRFDSNEPLWRMGLTQPVKEPTTTNLWRETERKIQFRPNKRAVIKLLQFLGFSKVSYIEPVERDLEERFYNDKRATFLACRD